MTDLTGTALGRYHLIERLGEGGMATVYKAFDTRLERDVAVKILRTEQFSPIQLEQVLLRFDREAKSLGKLSHPNIVAVLDYGEYENIPYLVMEYLPGGTLKQKLGQPLPWQAAIQVLLPVARALAYAHQRGIVHRDVKPANILLKESGTPVLTDFGIAKLLEAVEGQTLTASGVGIGTPEYMAPEQGLGGKVDARADIYALGTVFYELVTGRRPYIADTPMAVLLKHMTDPLPNPHQFVPSLPDEVERVLIKALAKQPDDRYQEMNAFAEALESLLANAYTVPVPTVSAQPPVANAATLITPAPATATVVQAAAPAGAPPAKKSPWLALSIGLLALAIIAVGGLILVRRVNLNRRAVAAPPAQPTVTVVIQPTAALVQPTVPPPTQPVKPTVAAAAEDCRSPQVFCVSFISDGGEIANNSFVQAMWEGVQRAQTELGAVVQYAEVQQPENFEGQVSQFAEQGSDVIVLNSFRAEITVALAKKYPQVKFIAVDQFQEQILPNVAGLVFREDQAGFMVGALAGLMSKSGRIGGVLGADTVPPVWRFGEGYKAGARYVRPDVKVSLVYHNEVQGALIFNDPEWGAATANQLVDQGVDVLFGAGGSTGNGAIEAAAKRGIYVIGVDVDQYFTLPNIRLQLLSSATKDLSAGVFELLRQTQANTFPAGNFYGPVNFAPFHETQDQIPETVRARLDEIKKLLDTGQLETKVSPSKP